MIILGIFSVLVISIICIVSHVTFHSEEKVIYNLKDKTRIEKQLSFHTKMCLRTFKSTSTTYGAMGDETLYWMLIK